jgi:cell division transport system permease protein
MEGWWPMARNRLRPANFDDLGLRRALGDRMLPLLVAAMAFLAALALGGLVAARTLAGNWQAGAGSALTVQVPRPGVRTAGGQTRLDLALALLRATPGIAAARPLSDGELADLLRPWLGAGAERLALPLPAVIDVRLAAVAPAEPETLAARLAAAVPGTVSESHGVWVRRLAVLARSLQACAWMALAVVAAVAASVVAIATRAGLASRREAIEIVHALGATDGYIAGRFASRATGLAAAGGAAGALAALPVLLELARLAAPFAGSPAPAADLSGIDTLASLPASLWVALPALPLAAAGIGFLTAHGTVRRWLRRLP